MAAAGSYADIAEAYAAEREKYMRLGELIAGRLSEDLKALHLDAIVQTRAKEVLSFVKKALRKRHTDPLKQIGDKAGIRVIVHYAADVNRVEEVVARSCDTLERESKLEALDYNEFGYLGVHLAVKPKPEILGADDADLAHCTAELQIHTKAQSAWAVVSHDLLYKTALEIPSDLKRTIVRLVALVELFDNEVARFQQQLHEHPDFGEMQVLDPLDDLLIEFTERRPDRALSALVVPPLVRLHGGLAAEDLIESVVRPFVEKHRQQLDEIYSRYADDYRATPLLYQPEALLVFATLERDPYQLREAWPSEHLPVDLLDELAAIWGIDLEEPEN